MPGEQQVGKACVTQLVWFLAQCMWLCGNCTVHSYLLSLVKLFDVQYISSRISSASHSLDSTHFLYSEGIVVRYYIRISLGKFRGPRNCYICLRHFDNVLQNGPPRLSYSTLQYIAKFLYIFLLAHWVFLLYYSRLHLFIFKINLQQKQLISSNQLSYK